MPIKRYDALLEGDYNENSPIFFYEEFTRLLERASSGDDFLHCSPHTKAVLRQILSTDYLEQEDDIEFLMDMVNHEMRERNYTYFRCTAWWENTDTQAVMCIGPPCCWFKMMLFIVSVTAENGVRNISRNWPEPIIICNITKMAGAMYSHSP